MESHMNDSSQQPLSEWNSQNVTLSVKTLRYCFANRESITQYTLRVSYRSIVVHSTSVPWKLTPFINFPSFHNKNRSPRGVEAHATNATPLVNFDGDWKQQDEWATVAWRNDIIVFSRGHSVRVRQPIARSPRRLHFSRTSNLQPSPGLGITIFPRATNRFCWKRIINNDTAGIITVNYILSVKRLSSELQILIGETGLTRVRVQAYIIV